MKNLLVLIFCLGGWLQAKMTPEQYIEKYKESAIREMNRSGVPASITLSQGMLESGNGNSELATKANNHFGIKCHSDWKGPSVRMDDDEKNECFRKYKSVYDSYVDHSNFLMTRTRYAFLFDLKITDYKGWAKGLKKAGYATNPKYPELLIRLIERHSLNMYDKGYKKKKDKPLPTEIEVVDQKRHKVYISKNRVKYVIIKAGDTFYSLEGETGLHQSMLRNFNDMDSNQVLKIGQRLYIQPKRGKAKVKYHEVKPADNLWSVSQKYAVKIKKLQKYNPGITKNLKGFSKVKLKK